MDKKTYIAPSMEIVEVESIMMIASSTPKIDVIVGGEGGSEILSTGRRGTWGNLWDEGEE